MANEKHRRSFKARLNGKCCRCNKEYECGEFIRAIRRGNDDWKRLNYSGRSRRTYHKGCEGLPLHDSFKTEYWKKADKMKGTPEPRETPETETQGATLETGPPEANGTLAGILFKELKPYLKEIETKVKIAPEELQRMVDKAITGQVYKIEVALPGQREPKLLKGCFHKQFKLGVQLMALGFNVYVYSAMPGTGKTTAGTQAAAALEVECAMISLNPQTPDYRLMGYRDANGNYVDADFYRLYKNGGIFVIDEMDNASASLLTTLNSALENGHTSFPCGMVEKHAEFRVWATGNTNGFGANPLFPERRAFDAANKERFVFIEWEQDEKLERAVALAHNPKVESWVDWVQHLRKHVKANKVKLIVSQRASINGAKLLKKFNALTVAHMVVFKGLENQTVASLLGAVALPKDM